MILYIEATKPEFTIYLDPPAHNPETIYLNSARIGISGKIFPPEVIHIYCDLIDSEDVRLNSKRTQLLGIIRKPKANQMSIQDSRSKIKTNGTNRVYSITFRITDGTKLLEVAPEKIYLEIYIA